MLKRELRPCERIRGADVESGCGSGEIGKMLRSSGVQRRRWDHPTRSLAHAAFHRKSSRRVLLTDYPPYSTPYLNVSPPILRSRNPRGL